MFSEFEDNNSQPPLSARIQEYLEANRGTHFSPDELIYVRSLSDCKNRDAMRKQLERLRKKGLIDAEDVVKEILNPDVSHPDRKTACRYKVYFAPCSNENVQQFTIQTQRQVQSLDTPKNPNEKVQRIKPLLNIHSDSLSKSIVPNKSLPNSQSFRVPTRSRAQL